MCFPPGGVRGGGIRGKPQEGENGISLTDMRYSVTSTLFTAKTNVVSTVTKAGVKTLTLVCQCFGWLRCTALT